jgi:hypothetical protein
VHPRPPEEATPEVDVGCDGEDRWRIQESLKGQAGARLLEEFGAALVMHATRGGALGGFDVTAFQYFRDAVLAGAGGPSDPVEVLLLEATVLAYLAVGRLYTRAATAADGDAVRAYTWLAATMNAELRRTALALKAYRTPAGGGLPPVERADPAAGHRARRACPDGEVGGNPAGVEP